MADKKECAHYADCPYRNDIGRCAYYCLKYRHRDDVRVVRCKDCMYGIWDEENEMWKCMESADYDEEIVEWFGFYEYHNGDFFCADGERKAP